jgi:hypothetical protein
MKRSFAALALATLVLSASSRASASASPVPGPVVPFFGLAVSGTAVVSGVEIEIACRGTDALEPSAACTIHARAQVRATSLLTIAPIEGRDGRAALDGMAVTEPTAIEAGQSRELVVDATRDLSVSRDFVEGFWFLPLDLSRHVLLADGPSVRRSDASAGFDLIGCEGLTFEGPIAMDARDAGSVRVHVGGERIEGLGSVAAQCPSVSLDVGRTHPDDSVIQQGGPVLSLGMRFDLDDDDGDRFLVRLSYELGLFEHAVMSLGVETDFDSLMESFVVEVGTPNLVIILPSIAVGVGVVARQLGDRDADAALRLRATIGYVCIGAGMDFDYWPATGEWTGTVVGRVSL